jgi:hypothetical protein
MGGSAVLRCAVLLAAVCNARNDQCAPVRSLSNDELVQFAANTDMLGISIGASEEEIRKAHRQLALQYHPDKAPNDPNAASKFHQVQEAYVNLQNLLDRVKPESCRAALTAVQQPRLYEDNPLIKALTPEYYRTHVAATGSVWLIQFYTPKYEKCRQQVQVFENATKLLAKSSNPIISIGALNCDEHSQFCRDMSIPCCAKKGFFNLEECPQMQLTVAGMRGVHQERVLMQATGKVGAVKIYEFARDIFMPDAQVPFLTKSLFAQASADVEAAARRSAADSSNEDEGGLTMLVYFHSRYITTKEPGREGADGAAKERIRVSGCPRCKGGPSRLRRLAANLGSVRRRECKRRRRRASRTNGRQKKSDVECGGWTWRVAIVDCETDSDVCYEQTGFARHSGPVLYAYNSTAVKQASALGVPLRPTVPTVLLSPRAGMSEHALPQALNAVEDRANDMAWGGAAARGAGGAAFE